MENERIYRHPYPGYTLPLWLKGQPITQKRNGKANAVFRDTGKGVDRCGLFRSSEDDVCKAIEESKAFKNGSIIRLASSEEIRLETLRQKRLATRETVVGLVKEGLFNLDVLEAYKADELKRFAEDIGVELKTDKGAKTKADVLDEVKGILFPNVVAREVVSDDKEEEEK